MSAQARTVTALYRDGTRMLGERDKAEPGGCVPQLNLAVVTSSGDQLAI